jgi:glycosidase
MRRMVALVVGLSLALMGACTRPSGEFPAGAWWLEEPEAGAPIVLLFGTDGTLMGNLGEAGQDPSTVEVTDSPAGEVTWSVAGDVLSLTAPCYDRAKDTVDQRTSTYRWAAQGDQLTLAVIEDRCPGEDDSLPSNVLTRLEAIPTVKGSHTDPVAAPVPWWNDEVFYEVFVRSFADSDGDGNGDLQGLIGKLAYLDDLGVTALWLMPIMQFFSNDTSATDVYTTVEQDYGANEDFKDLVAAAHARGIEVIVDLMLNHTSSKHPWFVESGSGPDAPTRDWYVWSATDPGTKTYWGSPAWHERDGAYYYGLFWEGMPDLNYRTPAVTAQMDRVARFWLVEMGADGFRLDAVRHLVEDGDQLADTTQTHEWLAAWDDRLDDVDPAALTVGEVWDSTELAAPYVTGDETDLVFEFSLAEQLLASVDQSDPSMFARQLRTVLAAYPPGQFAPFLTNHDQNRVMARLAGDVPKAKLAATALLTLPGVPFLYYGEEIGMVGRKPDEMIRTPMQWEATEGAGFTNGTPWEPINPDHGTVNVAAQLADPGSLLNHYRRLLDLRAAHPALSVGGLDLLDSTCDSVLAFLRQTADGADTVLVVHNFGATEATRCALSTTSSALPEGSLRATDLLAGTRAADLEATSGGAINDYTPLTTLPPRSTAVLQLTE